MDQVRRHNGAMVEQSAAARHALAPAAIEPARLVRRSAFGAVPGSGPARRDATRQAAKALRGKAYSSSGGARARLAPRAETDTWEEF
jgi:hypothetical protein